MFSLYLSFLSISGAPSLIYLKELLFFLLSIASFVIFAIFVIFVGASQTFWYIISFAIACISLLTRACRVFVTRVVQDGGHVVLMRLHCSFFLFLKCLKYCLA